MHIKLENIENVDRATNTISPTSSRISMEFKMTSFQSNGKPCNDNTQKPSFAMVEMHVKLGEEVIINIGQLQDKNNEYRDPNPDTNGSLKSSGMAQPPGLKIVLNDSNTPLKAVNAVTEVTKTVMDITQHKGYGSWTAFTNDITYRTTGVDEPRRKNAVRNRILINNKSIVKSIGDTAQELNVFANEGVMARLVEGPALDKHKRSGNTILPPTATAATIQPISAWVTASAGPVPNSLDGFRFLDNNDNPSTYRAFLAILFASGINPWCAAIKIDASSQKSNTGSLKAKYACRFAGMEPGGVSLAPPAFQIGGTLHVKTNRKRTIRRRKQKKAKKSKYHGKKKRNDGA